jgi:hypothetical protein
MSIFPNDSHPHINLGNNEQKCNKENNKVEDEK